MSFTIVLSIFSGHLSSPSSWEEINPIAKEFCSIKLSGLSIWYTKKKPRIYVVVLSEQFLKVL